MPRRDYYLWSALLFSLVSHGIAFLQFAINFGNLSLPDRWYLQFTILISLSLVFAVCQFVLYGREAALGAFGLARLGILLLATYPLGNYVNVRTTLLASLVFETMIYGSAPVSYILSAAMIAACLFIRRTGPLWDQRIGGITLDNLLFMGFYPLIVMVLGGLLKNAQRLASERKRLVEQLRKASTSLVETNIQLQEHVVRSEEQAKLLERERISRELHDTIGYTLMNIIATMKASMELSRTDTGRMLDFMGQGIQQAQKGLAETRAALRAMRGASARPLSLVTTLNRLVAAFKNTHIAVSASYSNIPWLFGEEIDSTIYRIVQEGITNAIRHGNATAIAIHVSWDGERISVAVNDNGSGSQDIAEGIGMAGIRERLKQFSGGVSAGNAAGGFQLYAWIPMKRSA